MISRTILLCFSLVLVLGQESSTNDPKLKIVNGDVAGLDEVKFAVLVIQEYEADGSQWTSKCTGTLIDRRTVITAAHCVYNATLKSSNGRVKIRYGAHDLTEPAFPEIWAKKLILHKGYDGYIVKDDIAIIKLEKSVKKDRKRVGFARLPIRRKYYYEEGSRLKVYGWGETTEDERGIYPWNLLKTTLTVVEEDPIIEADSDRRAIYARGKKTRTCHGDSGGPLVYRRDILIGVTSATATLGDDKLDKFTRVQSYLKWIKKHRKRHH